MRQHLSAGVFAPQTLPANPDGLVRRRTLEQLPSPAISCWKIRKKLKFVASRRS